MPRSLSLLVGLAILALVALADAARAGPDLGPVFVPFPLTRLQWQDHTLGPDRQVRGAQPGAEPELAWRVEFFSRRRSSFLRAAGTLELDPPERCAAPVLALPRSDSSSTTVEEIGLYRLRRRTSRVALVDEAAAAALLARFAREFEPIPPMETAPERCERMRERCDTGVARTGMEIGATVVHDPGVDYPGAYLQPGALVETGCDAIEESVQRCREWGARRVAEHERRRRAIVGCRALVVATHRAEDAVALRVVGDDGAEWGRVTVAPEETIRARAWILAPLTVPADVVLMGVQAAMWTPLLLLVLLSSA